MSGRKLGEPRSGGGGFKNPKPQIKFLEWTNAGIVSKEESQAIQIGVEYNDFKFSVTGHECVDGREPIVTKMSAVDLKVGAKLKEFGKKRTVGCEPYQEGDKQDNGKPAFNYLKVADQDGQKYIAKFQISEGEEKVVEAYLQHVPEYCFHAYDKELGHHAPVLSFFGRMYAAIFENFKFWESNVYAQVFTNEIPLQKYYQIMPGGDLMQLGYFKEKVYYQYMPPATAEVIEDSQEQGYKLRHWSIYIFDKNIGLVNIQLAKSAKTAFKEFFNGKWENTAAEGVKPVWKELERGRKNELLDLNYGLVWSHEDGHNLKENKAMVYGVPKFSIEVVENEDIEKADAAFLPFENYQNEYLERNRLRFTGKDPDDDRSEDEKQADATHEAEQAQPIRVAKVELSEDEIKVAIEKIKAVANAMGLDGEQCALYALSDDCNIEITQTMGVVEDFQLNGDLPF